MPAALSSSLSANSNIVSSWMTPGVHKVFAAVFVHEVLVWEPRACLYQRILLKISLPDPTDKGEQTGLCSEFSDKKKLLQANIYGQGRYLKKKKDFIRGLTPPASIISYCLFLESAADSSSVSYVLNHLWCTKKARVFSQLSIKWAFLVPVKSTVG